MEDVDKARELGAVARAQALGEEHGRRDAEAWLAKGLREMREHPKPADSAARRYVVDGIRHRNPTVLGLLPQADMDLPEWSPAYESAYREAVETTVREKCGEVTP